MDELILRNQKFKEDLVELVNKSELPAFIVEPILRELLEQIAIKKQLQLKKAIENKKPNMDSTKVELKPELIKGAKKNEKN